MFVRSGKRNKNNNMKKRRTDGKRHSSQEVYRCTIEWNITRTTSVPHRKSCVATVCKRTIYKRQNIEKSPNKKQKAASSYLTLNITGCTVCVERKPQKYDMQTCCLAGRLPADWLITWIRHSSPTSTAIVSCDMWTDRQFPGWTNSYLTVNKITTQKE